MNQYGYFMVTFILAALISGCAAKDMTLSNQGYEALSKADYAEAQKYFSEALYRNPDNPYALLNLGRVYQETGHPERARQMYEKVIALDPSDSERQSTTDSEEGKPLVEIAKESLRLLNEHFQTEESETPAPLETPTPAVISLIPLQEAMFSESEEAPLDETKTIMETNGGYYRVLDGDTLYDIAGREDIYNYPLKWPTLYRLNVNILGDMAVSEDFEHQELAEGLDLKLVTPAEAMENLMKLGEKLWVIHVRSTLDTKNIVPTAIRLMKKGYHVYMTKATVKGKVWTRLRVGFYRDQIEANEVKEKIVSYFESTRDAWVTRIPKSELDQFGGY